MPDIRASIGGRLVTNVADTAPQEPLTQADLPKIKHLGVLWTHGDVQLLTSAASLCRLAAHLVLTDSEMALNRLIRSRIFRSSVLCTTTSAI